MNTLHLHIYIYLHKINSCKTTPNSSKPETRKSKWFMLIIKIYLPFSGFVFLRESMSVLTAFKTKMISVTCCLREEKKTRKD